MTGTRSAETGFFGRSVVTDSCSWLNCTSISSWRFCNIWWPVSCRRLKPWLESSIALRIWSSALVWWIFNSSILCCTSPSKFFIPSIDRRWHSCCRSIPEATSIPEMALLYIAIDLWNEVTSSWRFRGKHYFEISFGKRRDLLLTLWESHLNLRQFCLMVDADGSLPRELRKGSILLVYWSRWSLQL